MDRGRILQVGKPWELYLRPGNRFVADFIGTMNVLTGRVEAPGQEREESVVLADFGERWGGRAAGVRGQPISLGVRPEALQLAPGGNAAEAWNSLQGTVTEGVYLGGVVRYQVGGAGNG